MTRRATKSDIRQVERVINGTLERAGYNIRICVEWAYGQPRAYRRGIEGSWRSELSPRLSTGEMIRWLYAFHDGLNLGLNRGNA